MKIITGFAVIKDSVGNRIAYTYSEINEQGTIVSSNKKESFVVLDDETNAIINKLESVINERIKQ